MSDQTRIGDSDELTVARWNEPAAKRYRGDDDEYFAHLDYDPETEDGAARIRNLEETMIDRGLGEEYGDALVIEVFMDGVKESGEALGCFELYLGDDFAKLATAPPLARLRALAAVARKTTARAKSQH